VALGRGDKLSGSGQVSGREGPGRRQERRPEAPGPRLLSLPAQVLLPALASAPGRAQFMLPC
jgi:hypothetical protein